MQNRYDALPRWDDGPPAWQPQPGEVLKQRLRMHDLAARRIGILYPQHEMPARMTRQQGAEQGRPGIAQVHLSGWAGGKAGLEHANRLHKRGKGANHTSQIAASGPRRLGPHGMAPYDGGRSIGSS